MLQNLLLLPMGKLLSAAFKPSGIRLSLTSSSKSTVFKPRNTTQQITVRCYHDRLLQQITFTSEAWESLSLQQNFVAAIYHTNSNCFEFVQHIAATKWLHAAAVQMRLLEQQSNLSPRCVTVICHIVCLGLKLFKHQDLILQYSILLLRGENATVKCLA